MNIVAVVTDENTPTPWHVVFRQTALGVEFMWVTYSEATDALGAYAFASSGVKDAWTKLDKSHPETPLIPDHVRELAL